MNFEVQRMIDLFCENGKSLNSEKELFTVLPSLKNIYPWLLNEWMYEGSQVSQKTFYCVSKYLNNRNEIFSTERDLAQ